MKQSIVKRNKFLSCAFLAIPVLLNFCTLEKRISTNPENRMILAAESSASCKIESVQSRWSFLGGLIPAWKSSVFFGLIPPLNSPLPEPPPGKTIRTTETAKWHDYTVTILLGWLFTITKRTFIVEFCEEGLYANHWDHQSETVEQQLYRMAMSGKVTVHLVSGETFSSKILGFDAENITLERQFSDPDGGTVDRLHLKDGSTVEGRIFAQNDHEVEIETKSDGVKFIAKDKLQRTEFRVPLMITERKSVRKADLQKLTFE
ncbi:LIC_13076 family protein [Leptospira fluminis]|nr:hypothetical protein [Leptospira fluminis]